MIDDPTLRAQRETAAATTGPHRIRPSPWVGPRQRSPEELAHRFGVQAPAVVVKFTTRCLFSDCNDMVNDHAIDPDAVRKTRGWQKASEQGFCIPNISPRTFPRVHANIETATNCYLKGARLIVIAPSETPPRRDGTLWILDMPEGTSIDQLCAQLGVLGGTTALPAGIGGEWACGPKHIEYALQRAGVGSRVITTTTTWQGDKPPNEPIVIACAHCRQRAAILSKAADQNPSERARMLASQGATQSGNRVFCGSTCQMLAGPERTSNPSPPLPPRAELKQKYAGWPASNAERIYRQINGRDPGEEPPVAPAPTSPMADPPPRPKTKGR